MSDAASGTVRQPASELAAFRGRAELVKTLALLFIVGAVAGGSVAMLYSRDDGRPYLSEGLAVAVGGLMSGLVLWMVAAWAEAWARHTDQH